jgi:hypothetical protein
MIPKTKSILVAWELIFSLVIMYNMITVPLMICFPWTLEEKTKGEKAFDYAIEFAWVL